MTKLRITVTKEILEKAKHCANDDNVGFNCAVSLAVRDIFPKAWCYQGSIVFNESDRGNMFMKYARFPESVFRWIARFDNAKPEQRTQMDPISFEIEIPDEVIATINIDELKPLLENHPTLAIVS